MFRAKSSPLAHQRLRDALVPKEMQAAAPLQESHGEPSASPTTYRKTTLSAAGVALPVRATRYRTAKNRPSWITIVIHDTFRISSNGPSASSRREQIHLSASDLTAFATRMCKWDGRRRSPSCTSCTCAAFTINGHHRRLLQLSVSVLSTRSED